MNANANEWIQALLSAETPIVEAIRALDRSSAQICLVVDESRRLLGTVTDGDVRRGILRNVPLDAAVATVMNRTPKVGQPGEDRDTLIATMTALRIHQMPLVDDDRRVVGLETLENLVGVGEQRPNWVVLMAGGEGRRLRPLTDETPKPLLRVGGMPILEVILRGFLKHRFHRFYISVNYHAEKVRDYFGDGRAWNADIRYLEEGQPLGTAGPLSLIANVPQAPIVVMNGDLMTAVNLEQMIDYHTEHGAAATMAVREYDIKVPFGVVAMDGNRITGIEEKPVHRFFVNAGVYILEPEVLAMVPSGQFFDMPDLFRQLIDSGREAAAFPVREYWLDIGQKEDFQRARQEFGQVFDGK